MGHNINLNMGHNDLSISQTHQGSEKFKENLKTKDLDELTKMLKDPKLKSGERRDVLNEIINRKADELAAIANDPNASPEERQHATDELAKIIGLGQKLKDGTIAEDELDQFATAIGLKPSDMDLPEHHPTVDQN
jgi:hypothetical protein